ncbi:MAG: ATP-binding protein [Chloroflexi bacterium]|nr:ATP-binding protein [Chloroflexota bacterium]
MEELHSLLRRQLRRHVGETPDLEPEWRRFLAAVDAAYRQSDADRSLLERSLELTSRELNERNQQLQRQILDAVGDALAMIAPDRRVLTINKRFMEFFRVSLNEVVGRDLNEFREHFEQVFAQPQRFLGRVESTASDAANVFTDIMSQQWPEQRELAVSSYPVRGSGGGHSGRLFIFRDVTKEREVDRMKTEFVSLVSHELRTPLTSIKGYIDLLLDGEVGDLSEDQREFLMIVSGNTNRLVTIINDLLDISRIESGKVELTLAPQNIGGLVREALTGLAPQIEAKRQQLTLAVEDPLPPVLADGDRITQVLNNLLSNAHKYTPAGGRITVGVQREKDRIAVEVADTGIGISPEEQSQLFTRFYRARNRTTQEVNGTGLGLAITRSLLELHGSDLLLTSAVGEGTTFRFTLPLTTTLLDTPDAALWGPP